MLYLSKMTNWPFSPQPVRTPCSSLGRPQRRSSRSFRPPLSWRFFFLFLWNYSLVFCFLFCCGNMVFPSSLWQSCKNVQSVQTSRCYLFLAGANFWEKHAKNRRKHGQTGENRRKTGAFLVLIFWGGKLVGANFYAFCNYALKWEYLSELALKYSSIVDDATFDLEYWVHYIAKLIC